MFFSFGIDLCLVVVVEMCALHIFHLCFSGSLRCPPVDPPSSSFRGESFFGSNVCDESGGAVYNGPDSKMT